MIINKNDRTYFQGFWYGETFTDRKYGVLYVDPPWHWETYSDKGRSKTPDNHYRCLKLDDIKNLPVPSLAADDCVLLIWTMDSTLDQCMELINHWGFKYITVGFYWVKTEQKSGKYCYGTGYWTRGNPEMCLLAKRGKPKRDSGGVRKLCVANRLQHSKKPDEIRDRIEALLPGPYLEIFARETGKNWDAIGAELVIPEIEVEE